MESSKKNRNLSIVGIAFISMLAGLALGAFLYSRIAGSNPSSQPLSTRKFAMHRVVLGQVGIGIRITKIVDGHDLNFLGAAAFIERSKDIAANTTVTIDCDFNCHIITSRWFRLFYRAPGCPIEPALHARP